MGSGSEEEESTPAKKRGQGEPMAAREECSGMGVGVVCVNGMLLLIQHCSMRQFFTTARAAAASAARFWCVWRCHLFFWTSIFYILY